MTNTELAHALDKAFAASAEKAEEYCGGHHAANLLMHIITCNLMTELGIVSVNDCREFLEAAGWPGGKQYDALKVVTETTLAPSSKAGGFKPMRSTDDA
jgi:hypothetical protein